MTRRNGNGYPKRVKRNQENNASLKLGDNFLRKKKWSLALMLQKSEEKSGRMNHVFNKMIFGMQFQRRVGTRIWLL